MQGTENKPAKKRSWLVYIIAFFSLLAVAIAVLYAYSNLSSDDCETKRTYDAQGNVLSEIEVCE